MMQECPICWRKLNPRRHRRYGLTCSHHYHEKCLQEWHNQGHEGCPICDPPAPPETEEGPKPCPHCGIEIIKIGGCNNMYCSACKNTFRWGEEYPHRPYVTPFPIVMMFVLFFLALFMFGVVVNRRQVNLRCERQNCLQEDLVPRSVLRERWQEIQELQNQLEMRKDAIKADRTKWDLRDAFMEYRRHFVSSIDFVVIFIMTLVLNGYMCITPVYWSSRVLVHGLTIVLLPILYYA